MIPLWDRLWAKVDFPDDLDQCWPWTGSMSKKRRGRRPIIRLGAASDGHVLVTRQVCTWYQGLPPTPAHEAGHTCPGGERSDCVNPQHLQWMTREENEQWKRRAQATAGLGERPAVR